ncbi:hypothetical protein CDAR_59471 [Caerostris darwini]|uniref:Uncharacterized protein n=1 Tax=Caerostris darwini TaxID=1538125 RepID=A0AAV4X3P3_9ARAC|nr:hypothetical protein CDAR_59471 [Caerostris darwini]
MGFLARKGCLFRLHNPCFRRLLSTVVELRDDLRNNSPCTRSSFEKGEKQESPGGHEIINCHRQSGSSEAVLLIVGPSNTSYPLELQIEGPNGSINGGG